MAAPSNPRHFRIEHRLRRRLRIAVPDLRKDPERLYALEILLRKRPAIRAVRSIGGLGGLVIDYNPTGLPESNLCTLLDAVIPNLGRVRPPAIETLDALPRSGKEREIHFAVEGISCASCGLLIELILRRDPRVRRATINLASETGVVFGDIPQEAVYEAVNRVGYKALPLDTVAQRKVLMEREELRLKEARRRAVIAAILSLPVTVIAMAEWPGRFWRWTQFVLSTPIVFWSGKPFIDKAVKLARQRAANMDSLIVLGVGAAYVYSTAALFFRRPYLYFDAASGIICFVLLGRYLEEKAKGRAHAAIRRLLDLQPQTANRVRNGQVVQVPVDDLIIDDLILIRPGDKIPTDGVVTEGLSTVDEAMLTGESLPVVKGPGNEVVGGCINGNGALYVRVTAVGADTVLAGIIHMVDQAQSSKLPIQKTVDRISAVFVPSVMLISGVTFTAWLLAGAGFTTAFATGITVLLIACPCALGLATPAAIMVGTGQAAQRGIYIRNGESLETATHVDTIIFDKTGTITEGKPYVTDFINVSSLGEETVLGLVASAEMRSEHFLGKALVEYAQSRHCQWPDADTFEAVPGRGLRAQVDGHTLIVGNLAWMQELAMPLTPFGERQNSLAADGKTPVFCVIDDKPAALFGIADRPREQASEAIRRLHVLGVETIMVTGDIEAAARYVAKRVGIDRIVAQARPEHKLEIVRSLQADGRHVGMIGDGINDAPALAAANVGFAIGTGTDVAIETADLTLVNGDITKVADALEISGETLRIIKQNLAWAFGYNTLAIPIAAFGKLNPMIASLAMALSSVSVVINSLRLQRK
ncbi:heavy metal translocating P-type ATPase [Methyloparacoccus murrellii]